MRDYFLTRVNKARSLTEFIGWYAVVDLPSLSFSILFFEMASYNNEWGKILDGHPVFNPPSSSVKDESLEFSLSPLPDIKHDEESEGKPTGRREVMCMKDSDLILACGSEIRMASLNDAKISGGSQRTYKVAPISLQFVLDC